METPAHNIKIDTAPSPLPDQTPPQYIATLKEHYKDPIQHLALDTMAQVVTIGRAGILAVESNTSLHEEDAPLVSGYFEPASLAAAHQTYLDRFEQGYDKASEKNRWEGFSPVRLETKTWETLKGNLHRLKETIDTDSRWTGENRKQFAEFVDRMDQAPEIDVRFFVSVFPEYLTYDVLAHLGIDTFAPHRFTKVVDQTLHAETYAREAYATLEIPLQNIGLSPEATPDEKRVVRFQVELLDKMKTRFPDIKITILNNMQHMEKLKDELAVARSLDQWQKFDELEAQIRIIDESTQTFSYALVMMEEGSRIDQQKALVYIDNLAKEYDGRRVTPIMAPLPNTESTAKGDYEARLNNTIAQKAGEVRGTLRYLFPQDPKELGDLKESDRLRDN